MEDELQQLKAELAKKDEEIVKLRRGRVSEEEIEKIVLKELLHEDTLDDLENPAVGKEDLMKTLSNIITKAIASLGIRRIPTVEEMSQVTSDLVEKNFPKNKCKERGAAIVLHAEMLIAIHDLLVGKGKG